MSKVSGAEQDSAPIHHTEDLPEESADAAATPSDDTRTPPASRHAASPVWLAPAVGTVITIAMLWRLSAMTEWSWYQDDWAYMATAVDSPFWEYVLQSYNGHLMPAQFALFWIWDRTSPMNYALAITALSALGVACLGFWAAAFRRLLGPRPVILIPTVILSLSPLFLPATLWPASGLQTLSMQASMGGVVYFAAAWWQDGRTTQLAGLLITFAVGLAFWEKALLVLVPLFGVLVFLNATSPRPQPRRLVMPSTMLAGISVAYLVAYVLLTGEDSADRPGLQPVTLAETFNFFRTGFIASVLPAVFGGPWNAQGDALSVRPAPSTLQQWLVAGAAAGLVCAALVYRRRAWIMIATLLAYVGLAWGIVLMSSRFAWYGDLGLLDGRYVSDSLPVFVLCGTLMIMPLRGEGAGRAFRHPPPGAVRSAGPYLSLGAAGVIAVSSLYTSTLLWDRIRPVSPKPWVTNATESLIAAGNGSVYDSTAPRTVVAWGLFDWDQLSEMMTPLRLPTRYNEPAERLIVLDGNGRATYATIEAGVTSLPGPVVDCGYVVRPGESAFVPMSGPAFAWVWGFQIDYYSQQGGVLTMTSDTAVTEVPLPPGLGQMQGVLVDSTSALSLSNTPGSGPMCISKISVGTVAPGDRIDARD